MKEQQTHKDWYNLKSIDAGVPHTMKYVNVVLYFKSLQHVAQCADETAATCTVPDTDN